MREPAMNAEQIIIEASSLPLEQRARVVDSILQTLAPTSAENDQAWLIVACGRLAELHSGEVAAVPGEAVFERILSRYGA
jgi:putative addiction module component (TIGR02574 family)